MNWKVIMITESKVGKIIKEILSKPQQVSVGALGGVILSERRYGGPLGRFVYEIIKAGELNGSDEEGGEYERKRKT